MINNKLIEHMLLEQESKKTKFLKALYWDTGNQNSENTVAPYHYVRIQHNRENNSKYDILIVGGEDHLTGNIMNDRDLQQRYTNLESWTRNRFPIEDIEFQWSGQVLEPKDGIAFIGYNPGDEEKRRIFLLLQAIQEMELHMELLLESS